MWLVAVGIVVLIVLLKPKIISEVEGKILPVPSAPSVSHVSSNPPEGSMQEIAQIQKDEPMQENFLENPALRMMGKALYTEGSALLSKGTMEGTTPMSIDSALLGMFSGDLQIGGQIGLGVGQAVAAVLPSIIPQSLSAGVATIGGEAIELGGEAAAEGIAELGVTGAASGIGFGIPFVGMVLGEMIGGAFEESNPFSKAQQQVIAQWEASGSSRARALNKLGFSDQQIIKWVSDNPGLNYWYAICPWPIPGRGAQADGTFLAIDQRVVLQGLYSQEEKDWLDDFVKNIGLGYIEIVGDESMGITWVERTYADVEGYLGGWHQGYVSLDQETQKFRQTPTQAEVMSTILGGVSEGDLQSYMASNEQTQEIGQPLTQAEAESTIFFGG